MKQSLTIREWLPPPVLNGSRQKHWATLRKEAAAVKTMAWASAKQAGWTFVSGKVRLTVTFVFPVKRTRDTDNLVARAKHLVDGLKCRGGMYVPVDTQGRMLGPAERRIIAGGFFTDDSVDWLELEVQAMVERGVKETRVSMEAVP